MQPTIRKTLIQALNKTIQILQTKEAKDLGELQALSDELIEDVAVYKDLDVVSLAVLIYSFFKVMVDIKPKEYQKLVAELKLAKKYLEQEDFGKYNDNVKKVDGPVRPCNAKIKMHLQDVMHAARIKKSASLLKKGLSIGQAGGLMGLSNWDLQQYVGKTTFMDQHIEVRPALSRLKTAMKIFQVTEKVKAK